VDVIHQITRLSKVGVDPYVHFMGKNLDRKLTTKPTKEFNLSKGGRAYYAAFIQDEVLRFTV